MKILFVLACLIVPVVWGALVNWVFRLWRSRNESKNNDETIFPDYQI